MPNVAVVCPFCRNQFVLRNTGQKWWKHCKTWHLLSDCIVAVAPKRDEKQPAEKSRKQLQIGEVVDKKSEAVDDSEFEIE